MTRTEHALTELTNTLALLRECGVTEDQARDIVREIFAEEK